MIPKEVAEKIRARIQAYEAARKGFDPRRYEKGGGYAPSELATIEKMAGVSAVSNEERSALEQFDFFHDAPEQYLLYVDDKSGKAITFTGDVLGRVERGVSYKSPSFGRASVRVPIKVYAINGYVYSGTYYASAGDYARIKRTKATHRENLVRANPCGCSARTNPRKSKRRTTRR